VCGDIVRLTVILLESLIYDIIIGGALGLGQLRDLELNSRLLIYLLKGCLFELLVHIGSSCVLLPEYVFHLLYVILVVVSLIHVPESRDRHSKSVLRCLISLQLLQELDVFLAFGVDLTRLDQDTRVEYDLTHILPSSCNSGSDSRADFKTDPRTDSTRADLV